MRAALLIVLAMGCGRRASIDAGSIDAASIDAGRTDGATIAEDGGSSLAFCRLGCGADADCTTASPAFDADNYACEGGSCRYTGCVSDVECQSTFADSRYVCRVAVFGSAPVCALGCNVANDCTSASPAFDADNYRCQGNVCVYNGCNDDAECAATFGAGFGCRTMQPPDTGLPLPAAARNCVRLCASASDCASDTGAFSADNYECAGDACAWTGCGQDAECRTSLGASYVCR